MKLSMRFTAALVLCAIASGCASTSGPPRNQGDVCEIFAQRPEWREATEASAKRWGAPVNVQMAIMKQESSFRHDARPPKRRILFGLMSWGRASSAYGYAQALDGTWEWYLKDTDRSSLLASREDFSDASDFVGWYMAKTREMTGVAMHDARNQYLAYHEGQGGYRAASYRKKPWLMGVSQRVAETAGRYGRQLRNCPG